MADITTATVLPIATLILGYAIKSVSDWLDFKRTLLREREARSENRREKITERRNEFQRNTLHELQEVAQRMARLTVQIDHTDEVALHRGAAWRTNMVGDDISEGFRECQARAMLLSARVLDSKTREFLDDFRTCSTTAVFSTDRDAAKRALGSLNRLHERLNEQIGAQLRELDTSDSSLVPR